MTVHHVISHENDCQKLEVDIPQHGKRILAEVDKHCASIDRALLRVNPQDLAGLSGQSIYRATAPPQIDQEIYFWGFGTRELRKETGVVESIFGDEIVTNAYTQYPVIPVRQCLTKKDTFSGRCHGAISPTERYSPGSSACAILHKVVPISHFISNSGLAYPRPAPAQAAA